MAEENKKEEFGQGQGFGRRSGRGQGEGRRSGQGQGRGRRSRGMSAGGFCVCPSCEYKEEHQAGKPCYEKKCPDCNTDLVRE